MHSVVGLLADNVGGLDEDVRQAGARLIQEGASARQPEDISACRR